MGYAVLHIDKARGNDSAMSAHIERTFVPNNVDASRTHLNRDLVQFPANVTNRTEAIAHRIATAGISTERLRTIKLKHFVSSYQDHTKICSNLKAMDA